MHNRTIVLLRAPNPPSRVANAAARTKLIGRQKQQAAQPKTHPLSPGFPPSAGLARAKSSFSNLSRAPRHCGLTATWSEACAHPGHHQTYSQTMPAYTSAFLVHKPRWLCVLLQALKYPQQKTRFYETQFTTIPTRSIYSKPHISTAGNTPKYAMEQSMGFGSRNYLRHRS